jgi:hypothetical protein
LDLNLALVRKATDSDYVSCLKIEVNMMMRRCADQDLARQCEDKLWRDTETPVTNLAEYFEDFDQADPQGRDGAVGWTPNEVPKQALLPVKHFYMKFPDGVRYFLNENSNYDAEIARNMELATKTFLRLRGIDIMNQTFTRDRIRESITKHLASLQHKQEQERRVHELICSLDLSQKYLDSRLQASGDFFAPANAQIAKNKVRTLICELFEGEFKNSMALIDQRLKPAAKLQKREYVQRMKKFLIDERFTSSMWRAVDRTGKRFLPPVEIVNDVTEISPEILEKYMVTQKQEHIKTTRKLTPEKYDMYLRGDIDFKEIYDINIKPDSPTSLEVNVNSVNKDYYHPEKTDYEFLQSQHKFHQQRLALQFHRMGKGWKLEEDFMEDFLDKAIKRCQKGFELSDDVDPKVKEDLKKFYFGGRVQSRDQFTYEYGQTMESIEKVDLSLYENDADAAFKDLDALEQKFDERELSVKGVGAGVGVSAGQKRKMVSVDSDEYTKGKVVSAVDVDAELKEIRNLVD